MTVSLPGIPSSIANLIQERTLERVFHDALFPRLLYRLVAIPEVWMANLGETQVFTRTGLITPSTAALTPGSDPTPKSYDTEQWTATANQYGDTLDTHMPTSYVSLASLFLRNTHTLGLNAGQVMNRIARNRLFTSYLQGEAQITAAAGAAATTVNVSTLNGFTENLTAAGRIEAVSATNPITVTFSTTGEPANTVTAAVPNDPAVPLGPGVLTLSAGLTTGCAARDAIYSANRSRRLRVGGGATVDAITGTNVLTLNDVISAVSRLRNQNVPPTTDGTYHCHLTTQGESQIFADAHWQRLHESLPDSYAYRELAIGRAVGCTFFRQTEDPRADTVSSTVASAGGAGGGLMAPEIGADIVTVAGLPIRREMVVGGGALYEKYLDESKYITEAGVTGKIGEFSVTNSGVQVMTQRIRFIVRSPLDRLQQTVSQTWSWSGDFPVPSDQTSGDDARFKRAISIEHG